MPAITDQAVERRYGRMAERCVRYRKALKLVRKTAREDSECDKFLRTTIEDIVREALKETPK